MKVLRIGFRVLPVRTTTKGDSRSNQHLDILLSFVTPALFMICRVHSFSLHHFQSHAIYGPFLAGKPTDQLVCFL